MDVPLPAAPAQVPDVDHLHYSAGVTVSCCGEPMQHKGTGTTWASGLELNRSHRQCRTCRTKLLINTETPR